MFHRQRRAGQATSARPIVGAGRCLNCSLAAEGALSALRLEAVQTVAAGEVVPRPALGLFLGRLCEFFERTEETSELVNEENKHVNQLQ